MKKVLLFCVALTLLSCNEDELDDKIDFYKNQNKSTEIQGFWMLKGIYNSEEPNDYIGTNIGISNGGIAGIGPEEIMFLDGTYLRFLNKSDEGFSMSKKNRFYWFNDKSFIKSVYKYDYGENLSEFQLPYKFGQTNDTLIVQSQGKVLYLLKNEPVEYTEYVFE